MGITKVRLTGGEPLLQPGFHELATALRDSTGKPVLVETNGSCDITVVPSGVVAIVDVKTPGSGMSEQMDMQNLARLRPQDEVKFVITNRADYEWSCNIVTKRGLASCCHAVLFSPAQPGLSLATLAGWIIEDRLPVRLNPLLHKLAGVR